MWETDDFDEGYLRLICLIGVIIFFLLGAVALALHLSLVDTVLFFSMGIPFLVLLLYGLFVTHEVMG